jgi:hypothetical protein
MQKFLNPCLKKDPELRNFPKLFFFRFPFKSLSIFAIPGKLICAQGIRAN